MSSDHTQDTSKPIPTNHIITKMVVAILASVILIATLIPFIGSFLGFNFSANSIQDQVKRLEHQFRSNQNDSRSLSELKRIARTHTSYGKCRALFALGSLSRLDKSCVDEIRLALHSGDPFVRDCAAQNLWNIGRTAEPATQDLATALRRYPNERTALFCAMSLREIGRSADFILDAIYECANHRDCYDPKYMRQVYLDLSGREMPAIQLEP